MKKLSVCIMFIGCAVATVPIAVGFDFLLSRLDSVLFKPKKH